MRAVVTQIPKPLWLAQTAHPWASAAAESILFGDPPFYFDHPSYSVQKLADVGKTDGTKKGGQTLASSYLELAASWKTIPIWPSCPARCIKEGCHTGNLAEKQRHGWVRVLEMNNKVLPWPTVSPNMPHYLLVKHEQVMYLPVSIPRWSGLLLGMETIYEPRHGNRHSVMPACKAAYGVSQE